LLKAADLDKTGFITYTEFLAAFLDPKLLKQSESVVDEAFNFMD
jgi:hypothetical protein